MPDNVRDLTVRLAFDHGDTKQQIAAIKDEIKLLDSGFQAAAQTAGGFSSSLEQSQAKARLLSQQIELQNKAIEKYGQAIQQAQGKLREWTQLHEQEGRKLTEAREKREGLKNQIDSLKQAMDAERAAGRENGEAYAQMGQQLSELQNELSQTEREISNLERAQQRSERGMVNSERAVQRFTTAQNLARAAQGQLQQQLDETNGRIERHADQWEAAEKKLRSYSEVASNAGEAQEAAGKKLSVVSAAIGAAGVAAGKAAIDWESAFAGVKKTVSGTDEQLAEIEQQLLSMEVPTDFADLADIAAGAGQLGIATENVVSFTRTMADLAETTNLSSDEAAEAFAQYANITGMPQENIERLGSVTVALGNNLATTESDIVDFATAISAAGTQVGMTDQQIFGIAGGLASLGLEAQAGGTAFSKAMIAMKVAVETGNDDLEGFAKVAGMTSEQFKEAFSQDAAGTFIQFVQGLSSGSESALVMLDEMGIKETRLRDTLLRASNASELMTNAISMANSAWTENSALASEAAVRYNTTASRMQMLQKNVQKTAISFGQSLLPILEKGMNVLQGVIEKFNGLSESQRENIIKWAAIVAAIGPAVSILGKANGMIGTVTGKLATFAATMAKGAAEGGGLLSALGGLLGPAGIAALAVGAGIAAYKLLDIATGAKAAREAIAELNSIGKEWAETQANTLYDTGNGDPLSMFGLSKEDFTGGTGVEAAENWLDSLITVWTDGKGETDDIVKQFTEGFTSGSDDVRDAIQKQADLLGDYNVLSPEKQAEMDADLKQLEEWDSEVEKLLKKRKNGFLTEEEQQRLQEIIDKRGEIEVKYKLDAGDGYDQIVTGMHAAVERARASGADAGSEVYGDALNALAEGRQAYMEALNASYDSEYAQIQLIDDEAARTQALLELNERYNEQRKKGEDAYNESVKEAATEAWQAGNYDKQIDQIGEVVAIMDNFQAGKIGITDVVDKINDLDLDEGELASMLSLVEQLKAAGATDEELLDLGIDTEQLYGMVDGIRQIAQETEGLEGVAKMFGEALPEEIQRIMIGLDMTRAAEDWAAFAEGGSLAAIKAKVAQPEPVDLTGNITSLATQPGVTFTADGDGNITSLTTADGVTYTADGDGNIIKVTTAEGVTFTVDGDGNVTSVTTPEGETIDLTGNIDQVAKKPGVTLKTDVNGNIISATTAEGVTFTADGDGNIIKVSTAEGVTFTADGSGNITSMTVDAGAKLPEVSTKANVSLNPLSWLAVSAWNAQNSGKNTSLAATVSTKLGAGWQSELREAFNMGKLAVYGADGLPLEVKPGVDPASMIKDSDVVLLDEDGTLHVVITPEVGTPEGVSMSSDELDVPSAAGTKLDYLSFLSQSPREVMDGILGYADTISTLRGEVEQLSEEFGYLDPRVQLREGSIPEWISMITSQLQSLEGNSDSLEEIGSYAANLMAALSSDDLDPETAAEYQAELQKIVDLISAADEYLGEGNGISEGIAKGMAEYGFDGDAATVKDNIQSAIDGALQINSPSKVMEPSGSGISEGIAQGMTQFSFAAAAASVAGNITGAFAGLPGQGQGIGDRFGQGLQRGLAGRLPEIIRQGKDAANQIAQAFREAWDIHSPSGVAEDIAGMFGAGLEKGMESWPRVSERLLNDDLDALYRGARRDAGAAGDTTNNNNNSVNLNIAQLKVSDRQDAEALAYEIASLSRASQRASGHR